MDELERLQQKREGLAKVAAVMRELEILHELLDSPDVELPDGLRKALVDFREAMEQIDCMNTKIVAAYRKWLAEQGREDPDLALVGKKGVN